MPFDSIAMPPLNVRADGHIVPPATSRAPGPRFGTSEATELAWPGVTAFLRKHDRTAIEAAP